MEGLTDDEVAEITGLRPGTVRVRLHRARLFVRKELMDAWKPARKTKGQVPSPAPADTPRPARCKAMFAELSNYLDEQLDDSLCEELERHLDGCGPCRVFLATLEATIKQCRTSGAECATSLRAAQLRKQLTADYKRAMSAIRSYP
jgi:RNA polymerase sigma-70 factor (ECF subfamily)